MTDKKRAYNKEYDKQNTKMICIKLNYRTDANLISFLESKHNVQGFIKALINEWLDQRAQTEV